MQRRVEPELLDELPPDEPRAKHSRCDLRRANRLMGHAEIIARHLATSGLKPTGGQILELGAGDGTLLLAVAQLVAPRWRGMNVVLVDKQSLVGVETRDGFHALGWEMEIIKMDVFDWLRSDASIWNEVIIANLFLHHLSEKQLVELLRHVVGTTKLFVACEPRRSWLPFAVSHLLWLVGCNSVTRHDAVISVRAGFAGNELSALWPNDGKWQLSERATGLFSHVFAAVRQN